MAVRPGEGRFYGCPPGKGATAADLPLISRLRAAASPKGEAGDFYFDSFFSSVLLVSHSFWLRST